MADNSGAARAEILSARRAVLLAEARRRFAQLADTNDPAPLKTEIDRLLKRANLGYNALDPSGRSTTGVIRNSIETIVALQGVQHPGDVAHIAEPAHRARRLHLHHSRGFMTAAAVFGVISSLLALAAEFDPVHIVARYIHGIWAG